MYRSYDSFDELEKKFELSFSSRLTSLVGLPNSGVSEASNRSTIVEEISRAPALFSSRFMVFTDSAGNRTVKRFWVDVSNYSSFIPVRMMLILDILVKHNAVSVMCLSR